MSLKNYLLQLFVSGFICSFALNYSGKGALKEPIRICCACIMIICFLMPLCKGIKIDGASLQKQDIERYVYDELSSASAQKDEYIKSLLETKITERLKSDNIKSKIKAYIKDEELIKIEVECNKSEKNAIESLLSGEYGINRDKMVWRLNED